MAATALLKFTQGITVGPDGQMLVGVLNSAVTVANSDNTDVASWQIDLLYSEPASDVSMATPFAFSNNSSVPSTSFEPDVRGSYRWRLSVWEVVNRVGAPSSVDIRVFAVPEASGLIVPPSQLWPLPLPDPQSGLVGAQPNEMNLGGTPFGWSGGGGDGLLNDALRAIGSSSETKKVARVQVGLNLIFLGATSTCDEVQGAVTLVVGMTVFSQLPTSDMGHFSLDRPALSGVYSVTDVTDGVATVERLQPWNAQASLEALAIVCADQGPIAGLWEHTTVAPIAVDTTELTWAQVTYAPVFDSGTSLVATTISNAEYSPLGSFQLTVSGDYVLRAFVTGEVQIVEGNQTPCSIRVTLDTSPDGDVWAQVAFVSQRYVDNLEMDELDVGIPIAFQVSVTSTLFVRATITLIVRPGGPTEFVVTGGQLSATRVVFP
jgi:hypothetical protein